MDVPSIEANSPEEYRARLSEWRSRFKPPIMDMKPPAAAWAYRVMEHLSHLTQTAYPAERRDHFLRELIDAHARFIAAYKTSETAQP
jgi:hypothetical protein